MQNSKRSKLNRALLNKLISLAKLKGVSTKLLNTNTDYDGNDKTIRLNSQLSMENKIFCLAHEIGHHICDEKYKRMLLKQVNRGLLSATDNSMYQKEDEINAWNYANKLAEKYGFYTKEYLRFKHKRIRTYYSY